MTIGTPPAEVEMDEHRLRALLAEQHADLAELPIKLLDAGWDNFMFRLGDKLIARLPRRELAARLLIHEQDWLPMVARDLPLPVPIPLRHGVPSGDYPWRWSIVPWLPGTAANLAPPAADQAELWAAFLQALHRPAPDNAPANPLRGGPLADRTAMVAARLERLRKKTNSITPAVETAWARALETPLATRHTWLHGDLHARNVLVQNGEFSGVIDWGDLTAGDPATDLFSVWMLFADRSARERVLTLYGANNDERRRAMGWAVAIGTALLDSGLIDHPQHACMGAAALARISEDV